jgi:UDP:flavonoid glycosyltransferase YjiC (YdhE family)
MTALSHGVPVVAVPGLGRDQRPIAARVADLGLGIALADDATSGEIRDAVSAVLGDRGYRRRARSFARRHAHTDAALEAALEVEAMIG